MKHKNYDYQSIEPFEKLQQRKGWVDCCSERCFRYYKKNTDKNINASIKFTFKYIKSYYAAQRFNKNMSSRDEKCNTNDLLERYKDLDNSLKNSISIITSTVISFFISFGFALFTLSNNNGENFFISFAEMIDPVINYIVNNMSIIMVIALPIILVLILLCLSPLIITCIYPIYASKEICSINSTYKQIIVPYERDEIIDTLATYNQGYSKLK